jgi:choline dehydrogenase-like flavoprotein
VIDGRTVPTGTTLTPDIAIVGGGPAGISLALALADSKLDIVMLESGGVDFSARIQKMYAGTQEGVRYTPLDAGRLRFLGGSTNHWGGFCRPLDAIDFEARDWVPHSGWPFARGEIEPYFERAQALCEAGPWLYDHAASAVADRGSVLALGKGGLYTSWFQFSKTRGGVLPTYFGHRYEDDLKHAPRVKPLLHANVTAIRLSPDGGRVDRLDIATLTGNRFEVKPQWTVRAAGARENARLMLVSNDVAKAGIGNGGDLVGRFFADHPIPRDVATLVVFSGSLAPFYADNIALPNGAVLRGVFSPSGEFARARNLVGSLTTVEQPVSLDETGTAAVITTAEALGVDASNAKAFSLGCGIELMPDPERRLTLTTDRDALGLPRLKLAMRVADSDFALYRQTLIELGRQLLAAKTGMLRLNRSRREEWLKDMPWGNHHLGTTRMSTDPKTGVVDADCKVHGIANLYVAGSSVFPTYGSSNPTMNLVALTLRLADRLKKVTA